MRLLSVLLLGGVSLLEAASRAKPKRYRLIIEVRPFPDPREGHTPYADAVFIDGVRIGLRPRDGATAEDIRREVVSALAQGLEDHLTWACMPELGGKR